MNVIPLSFTDFKQVCDEYSKRIYYYITDNIMDLYFVSEGMLVWTYLDVNTIENKEAFFSQRMFVGAKKLLFKIPVVDESTKSLPTETVMDVIMSNFPEENMPDIQKSGVEQ